MDEHEKGDVIYLRSYKEKLVEQVFLKLHHTISNSDSWNSHVLLEEIYEDLFLPIAKPRDSQNVKVLYLSQSLRTKLRKKTCGLNRIVVSGLFPKILPQILEPHFVVIISDVSVVWSKCYPGSPGIELPCFVRGWLKTFTIMKVRRFDYRKKNRTFF